MKDNFVGATTQGLPGGDTKLAYIVFIPLRIQIQSFYRTSLGGLDLGISMVRQVPQ